MTTNNTQFLKQIAQGLHALGIRAPAGITFDGASVENFATSLLNRPAINTSAVVAAGSALFYAVEKNHNPKVNDIYDASIYCSTCLSVGYGDIFAKTPLGKIIGTTLMTIGPALSGATLDGAKSRPDSTQSQILETLQAILQRLPAK